MVHDIAETIATMVDYGERLKDAMKASGMKTQALANAMGLSYQAVKKVQDGTSKAFTAANNVVAARVLGVSPTWLANGEGARAAGVDEPQAIDLDDHPELERVRKVKLRLQAGVSGFSVEADEGDGMPIFFRADWLQMRGYKPYNLIAIKVMGQSMEPNLHAGDMVVINTADTEPKDGKVFAVNYEGEAVIKRIVRDSGIWWLSSDNPDQRRYPRKECTEGSCIIVGQVIHKQSEEI